jgi:hypothetical protein
MSGKDTSGDVSKVNACERPALDERERDSLGARLRFEHRRILDQPLPGRMRDLLSKLSQKN